MEKQRLNVILLSFFVGMVVAFSITMFLASDRCEKTEDSIYLNGKVGKEVILEFNKKSNP